jgi:MFS transporter, DHA2 family, methylenomycin A resistance protein
VFGMQLATAISTGLLLAALVLGCLVHPEPHEQQPEDDSSKASPGRRLRAIDRR